MNEHTIRDLTETAAHLVGQIVPDCEGACLGTSAILAHVFRAHGVKPVAVRGHYNKHPHWWLETGTLRIDATRSQFDRRPLVEAFRDMRGRDPYVADRSFPPGWDRQQAVAEFARMFEYGDVGEAHGRWVLAELERVASDLLEGAVTR